MEFPCIKCAFYSAPLHEGDVVCNIHPHSNNTHSINGEMTLPEFLVVYHDPNFTPCFEAGTFQPRELGVTYADGDEDDVDLEPEYDENFFAEQDQQAFLYFISYSQGGSPSEFYPEF